MQHSLVDEADDERQQNKPQFYKTLPKKNRRKIAYRQRHVDDDEDNDDENAISSGMSSTINF